MENINNKLIQLLNTFSKKEIEQFRKFISSPFISKGRNYFPYLDYILNFKNDSKASGKKANKSASVSELNLSKQTLKNRYSELYKLGEEFLTYKWLHKNKLQKDKIILEALHEKKLNSHLKTKFLESNKEINLKKFDLGKLKNLSDINEIYTAYLQEINNEELVFQEYYEKSVYNLCYYLISIFENGIEFFQQENNNIRFDPNYVTEYLKLQNVEELIHKFRKSDTLIFKVVAMKYNLYKAFEDLKNENEYFLSHKIFRDIFSELEDNYKTYIFMYMINYCIGRFNNGDDKFKFELFDLYNEKLGQNLISDLKKNSYSFNHFRDYVFIGLELEDYDWVKNFIIKYSVFLPDNLKEDEIKLSYAKLDFEKKKFQNSLANLIEIKPTHYLLYLDTSVYKLFNYYELSEFEESIAVMNNIRQYFKNNKYIPKVYHNRHLNFIKILKKLVRLRTELNKEDPGLIKMEFEKLKEVTGKKWLTKKINEISS